MFESILKTVDEKLPSYENRKLFSDEEWLEFTKECLYHIMVFDDYIPTFELLLGKDLLSGSTQDLYYHKKDYSGISFCRIRPDNNYFIKNRMKLPSPSDPKGPSATGLAIELGLYGGHTGKRSEPASVVFSFEVWGRQERQAFKELFTDYRRIVHLLLSGLGLEFWTACVFESVDAYKKHDADGKLERYLAEDDYESSFSLQKTFYGEADEREFAKIFMVFLILYSSCMNRLVKRGNKDILLDYYLKVR